MHVVQMRHAQEPGNEDTDETAFLVRVHRVVPAEHRAAYCRQCERRIKRSLRPRRPDLDALHEGRAQRPENAEPTQADI